MGCWGRVVRVGLLGWVVRDGLLAVGCEVWVVRSGLLGVGC